MNNDNHNQPSRDTKDSSKSNQRHDTSCDHIESWIGTAAAAKHVGASVPTFRRWLKAGHVTAKRTPTGELRFRRSELDQLIG